MVGRYWISALAATGLLSSLGCAARQPAIAMSRPVTTKDVTPYPDSSYAVDVGPTKPTAAMYTDFAAVEVQMRNFDRARQMYEKALKADPKHVDAYVGLARLCVSQGQPVEAQRVLERCLEKLPQAAGAWNELGVLHARREAYPAAINALETAVKFDPNGTLYKENLASVYATAGELRKSYQLYCQLMPTSDAHYRIAGVLYSQGNLEGSRGSLEQSLLADPRHRPAADMIAKISKLDPEVQPAAHFTPAANQP